MRRVTPQEFRDAFTAVASEKVTALHHQWVQHNDSAYTTFIRSAILPPIAERLKLIPWCNGDYNHLDAIFYEQPDTEHFTSGTYAKALNVVIEHENARGKTTYIEINKLQHYNTPLKVFIGYVSGDEEAAGLLEDYAKIIQDADIFGDIATLRRQLVIFGDNPSEGHRWTFYCYEDAGFAPADELRV
jgi:hypothetical protein